MDDLLREQLAAFLQTAQAHMTFLEAVADFPMARANDFPPHVDYTPWMLLEHCRRTQKDILDFMIDPGYNEPKWPDAYWPEKGLIASSHMWKKTISEYKKDLQKIIAYISDNNVDLSAKVKNGTGQTIIREILLVIDHTSYHIGEFAILRQIMGTWPASHENK